VGGQTFFSVGHIVLSVPSEEPASTINSLYYIKRKVFSDVFLVFYIAIFYFTFITVLICFPQNFCLYTKLFWYYFILIYIVLL